MNISKKTDIWYKEWSGIHHTENSGIAAHDSADAQDFAQYCIRELEKESEFLLIKVIKKLTLEIKSYELAGRLGYAEAHRKTRRMILAEIQQLKEKDFAEKLKARRKIRAILKQEKA